MNRDTQYSPLVESLQNVFNVYADRDHSYLLVYWQGWGERTAYEPVKKGQYPWAVHDHYMGNDNNASILAIAFDLNKTFDEQMPDHMRQMETLQGFAFRPMVHIPDRTGSIPYEMQERQRREILNPRPKLRLVQ